MVKHKAFFYGFGNSKGVGVVGVNEYEEWKRVSFYSFGKDIDEFYMELIKQHSSGEIGEDVMRGAPSVIRSVIAGGVVFRSMNCVLPFGIEVEDLLERISEKVKLFSVIEEDDIEKARFINPASAYWYVYRNTLLGVCRVIFFEYGTQFAFSGIYRPQDKLLLEQLSEAFGDFKECFTVPHPLISEVLDERMQITLYVLRSPLKEEMEDKFVSGIISVQEIDFFDFSEQS